MPEPAQKESGQSGVPLRLLPGVVRRSGWPTGSLKRALRRNTGLRLISLLLAFGLWFFVNAGQHGSLESFNVPVSYRNLPRDMVITNPHIPQSVRIEIEGPRTLLSLIDPSRLALRLDLTGVTTGQTTLRVNPEVFNVPRQTNVVGVTPSIIVLDIDQVSTRNVPVHVMLSGIPADGYRVAATEVDPPVAAVRGPSRELVHLSEVASLPIDVTDVTGNLMRRIPLLAPSGTARLEPDEVTANVIISPVVIEKEFRGIPVDVKGTGLPFRLTPSHIGFRLRGPQLTLEHFDPQDVAVIDADGMMPGSYDIALQLTLPAGVDLVRQSADKVKLRIYREKRMLGH